MKKSVGSARADTPLARNLTLDALDLRKKKVRVTGVSARALLSRRALTRECARLIAKPLESNSTHYFLCLAARRTFFFMGTRALNSTLTYHLEFECVPRGSAQGRERVALTFLSSRDLI